jgi:pimeloyl-ACP methyl ester carboxylesterase
MRFILLLTCFLSCLNAETTMLKGKKIFYESRGTGATTLLMIHGWACDHTFFEPQLAALSKTHRVIAIDLPGHGQSDAPPAFSVGEFAQAVEAVRLATKSAKPILIGHSLGAVIAREHARQFPNQAKALVFLDGAIYQLPPGEADRERWSEGISGMAKRFGPANEKQTRERNISVFLSNLYTDETPRELRMSILKKVLSTSAETAQGAMLSMADLKLWREDKLDLPVLALRAGRQQPPGEDIYLKTLFPRIQYKFLPGVSHFLMLEKPDLVNAEILSFLKVR